MRPPRAGAPVFLYCCTHKAAAIVLTREVHVCEDMDVIEVSEENYHSVRLV